MKFSLPLLIFCLVHVHGKGSTEEGQCTVQDSTQKSDNIIDISTPLTPNIPIWDSGDKGLGDFMTPQQRILNGDPCNVDDLKLDTHTGTHIDAEQHHIDEYRQKGIGIESLDLNVLIGPVLVIEFTPETNISRDALEKQIPKGVERVLFKTKNTERKLMYSKEFVTDYVGVDKSGAEWIVENGIKLVGLDYLSVLMYPDGASGHQVLLSARVILVEGLSLGEVEPGLYELICLPLKIQGANGSPARCVLRK
eukprot:TRINITY_DN2571_c0_g3_i1.p1 TRINITY_DN2571_c0_g3~~TRINITY_DN2571_c0_g3_i1.p1  ORF type:complete len:251 (-),score=53.39 TRINITY_DN2571_c0_g3_i1:594-1346(-)